MEYLFDTNVILAILRETATRVWLNERFQPFENGNIAAISVITLGELESIVLRNGWGKVRIDKLDRLLDGFVITDIHATDVVKRYAEIDTFSQGKLTSKTLHHSARNMGKNDIWIAATAAAAEIPLLTTDNDFDHLANSFISLIKVPILK